MKPVDLLYMGLGAAFLAKDKFEAFVDDLEKRGELSKTEAQKFLDDAKARAKQEEEAMNAREKSLDVQKCTKNQYPRQGSNL